MPKTVSKTSPPLPPLPKHSPWLKAGKSLGVVALGAHFVACEIDEDSSLAIMNAGKETVDAELSPPMPAPDKAKIFAFCGINKASTPRLQRLFNMAIKV